jgi:hypothetical protein
MSACVRTPFFPIPQAFFSAAAILAPGKPAGDRPGTDVLHQKATIPAWHRRGCRTGIVARWRWIQG